MTMKRFALVNQKGGVGKTTTAINLATALAATGKKILLIDFDPQGNASTGLGVTKNSPYNSYSILWQKESSRQAIIKTAVKNLDVIPTNTHLSGAEVELATTPVRETILKQALSPVEKNYDYIFVDCPPSLGLLTVNALTWAQGLLVPMQCEFYALEGLSHLVRTCEIMKNHHNPELAIQGIILTMYDRRSLLNRHIADDLRTHMKPWVYQTPIPRNVRLSEAASFGKPILLHDLRSLGAQAYIAVAKEFLKRHNHS